jgi:hypothetical protein
MQQYQEEGPNSTHWLGKNSTDSEIQVTVLLTVKLWVNQKHDLVKKKKKNSDCGRILGNPPQNSPNVGGRGIPKVQACAISVPLLAIL